MNAQAGDPSPRGLVFGEFGSEFDPFLDARLGPRDCDQTRYVRRYLTRIGAQQVLYEPRYIDRDYTSEHSAFYGVSSGCPPNYCGRFHFFTEGPPLEEVLQQALGGSIDHARNPRLADLQERYLGFVVRRPLHHAPLGRTVLRWWPPGLQRKRPTIAPPSRKYEVNIGGLPLHVDGLAWQQQDSGVSACATIALWTMFNSIALDEIHAIPTTAEITRLAHQRASLGSRVFPTSGLTLHQVLEAIKECRLAPAVAPGKTPRAISRHSAAWRSGRLDDGFEATLFRSMIALLVGSGYPCLLVGDLPPPGGPAGDGLEASQDPMPEPRAHVVCAVGFERSQRKQPPSGTIVFGDDDMPRIFVHDDNLGPSVECNIEVRPPDRLDDVDPLKSDAVGHVRLRPTRKKDVPATEKIQDPTQGYGPFVPTAIVAALPEGLRTSPEAFLKAARLLAMRLRNLYALAVQEGRLEGPAIGLTLDARFVSIQDFLGGGVLERRLSEQPAALARVRRAILERVGPICLHLGWVTIGLGARALMDVIFDTTGGHANIRAFCHIPYDAHLGSVAASIPAHDDSYPGPSIDPFA